jgi:P-aminobenzoate N-oxygenase AurF
MEREHEIDIRKRAAGYAASLRAGQDRSVERCHDIDWKQPLASDGGLISDDLVDIHGTKFWDRLSDHEKVELNRCVSRWRISTLMAGEHGAMLVCSQLVENAQGQDKKLFQATQVVDEARHNEVLNRYVTLHLDDET